MTSSDLTTSENPESLNAQLQVVYNLYRTALLNCKYYADRLVTLQKWNTIFEIALVIGTSGTIGTWAIWKSDFGGYVWPIIGGIAAVLAITKPVVQLSRRIEQYSKLWANYSGLFYDLDLLVSEISATRTLTPETLKSFSAAQERYKGLALREEDPRPVEKLRRKYYEEVNREIPPDRLWVPVMGS